ncbi:unnamed protein product [Leptosia nina]|uniref:Uncharacterized protein n=1 Tax=Leptosia nina TaxID=320188 RepID=A0AAV1J7P1_9NEOP
MSTCVTQDDKEIPISVSKSVIPKKRKTKLENTVHPECISNIVDLNTDNIKKSKKKIKNKQTITEAPNETSVETEEYVPKKKKKKKNKDL